MIEDTLTRRVMIEGLVQGVGYRHFVVMTARRLGVSGWVRNRADGTVEALISGPPETIEAMLAALRRGPSEARVRTVRLAEVLGAEAEWSPGAFDARPTA